MEDTKGLTKGMKEIPAPVSSVYCLPHEAQLTVKRKLFSFPWGRFTIKDGKDGEGTLLFDVKAKNRCIWRKRLVLHDESGQPLLLLKSMFPSLHHKWAAYRGDDETDAKLLFTIQKSAFFEFTPSYNVFLPTNTDPSRPDFTIEGNFLHTACTVFYKGSRIAKSKRICFSTKHVLTVYPGADRAFISALVIVLYSQCGQH
ncbi:unnamed protein product [Calypogeia fissa]